MIINMLFVTFTSSMAKVLFHKTMAFVVKLFLPQFLPVFASCPTTIFSSRVPCAVMAPDTLLLDKIVSCHLNRSFYMPDVPDHIILSVLCHYKHLCRICWASKVRILSSYATTSQSTAMRSSRAVTNIKDCTLDTDYGKEIARS